MSIADKIQELQDALFSTDTKAVEALLADVFGNPEFEHSCKITILKAQHLLRRKEYKKAIEEINKALKIAYENGRRADLSAALHVKAIIYFRLKDYPHAFEFAVRACHFDDVPNSEVKMFKNIVQEKYLKERGVTEADLKKKEQDLNSKPSGYDISTIDPPLPKQVQTPVANKKKDPVTTKKNVPVKTEKPAQSQTLRTDWFDSGKTVELSIYVKNISAASVILTIKKDTLGVKFNDTNGNNYNYTVNKLFDEIDDGKSSFKVYGTKLSILLAKKNNKVWKSLEGSNSRDGVTNTIPKDDIPIPYTSSANKKVEWTRFNFEEDDEDDEEDGTPQAFFEKLYREADSDAQKAMMKSFMESNGTSLSTDWEDVGSRRVDPYVDGEVD